MIQTCFFKGFTNMQRFTLFSLVFFSLIFSSASTSAAKSEQMYYELIRYQVVNDTQMGALEAYWQDAAIPAFNRIGVAQIGVFKPQFGAHGSDLFVLLAHSSLQSYSQAWDKLANDQAYQKAAASFIHRAKEQPVYYRYSTSLLKAFSYLPSLEIPANIQGKSSRLFEMRTYESHSKHDAKMKIEMFNEGGELALFRETGLHPVMFGETIAGNDMPNLVYILGFENMTERDANWANFVNSEGWNNMKDIPKYKTTVSAITDVILKPTAYSQL